MTRLALVTALFFGITGLATLPAAADDDYGRHHDWHSGEHHDDHEGSHRSPDYGWHSGRHHGWHGGTHHDDHDADHRWEQPYRSYGWQKPLGGYTFRSSPPAWGYRRQHQSTPPAWGYSRRRHGW